MKKLTLSVFIGCIILYTTIFSPFAFSIESSIDVTEGEEFIWKVETFKEEIYNTYFTEDADFIEGVQEKKAITGIEERSEYWEVSFEYWNYTLNTDKLTEEADSKKSYIIYKDPEVQANKTLTIEDILNLWLIPTPISNYLTEYRDHFNISYVALTTTDNGVTYVISPVDYEIQIQYTPNGVAKNIKYVETDGNVFVEIGLYSELIHGYPLLPLLISVLAALSYLFIWMRIKYISRD
ncbi:MAG: hypothetical protein R6U96_16315 [Promethearchaeia archaeon]